MPSLLWPISVIIQMAVVGGIFLTGTGGRMESSQARWFAPLSLIAAIVQIVPAYPQERWQFAAPAAFEWMTPAMVQTLEQAPQPHVIFSDKLTLETLKSSGVNSVSGFCIQGSRVAIASENVENDVFVPCLSGQYKVDLPSEAARDDDITASQVTSTGDIAVAQARPKNDQDGPKHNLSDLTDISTQANGFFNLPAKRFIGVDVTLNARPEKNTEPTIIDGGGTAEFVGATHITIQRPDVTLRGFVFSGDVTITIAAPRVRITQSVFNGCGVQGKPKAECILVMAEDTEIDFNHFSESNSVTVKVRAGTADAAIQPLRTYIHHNEFFNIERHSGNGQEPIQVAGPEGGASDIDLHTRIEHNIFYATNGDVEAVSAKVPGIRIRSNAFFDMDAAPNLRGADADEISGNVLVHTRPIRIAGKNHHVTGNIILCPKDNGIALSHGSAGYAVAKDNSITGNLVIAQKSAISFFTFEPPPIELAQNNTITGNILVTPERYDAVAAVNFSPNTIKDNLSIHDERKCR